MEWVILFAASWTLFFLLKGWEKLRLNMWCGLAAVAMQFAIDTTSFQKGLYNIENPVIPLWGSSVFFCLGPVFVISCLLAKYHPIRPKLVITNVVILVGLYSLQEYLLLARNVLVYHNWSFSESIFINFIVITTLSWISFFILGRGGVKV